MRIRKGKFVDCTENHSARWFYSNVSQDFDNSG